MGDKGNCAVYVVATGACTAIGFNAPSSAAAIRAGIAGFVEHPYLKDKAGNAVVVAGTPYVPWEKRGKERLLELALKAAVEAFDMSIDQPLPVIVGLPEERPGVPETLETTLAEHFRREMETPEMRLSPIETISTGHSSGLMSLQRGWERIGKGECELCLIGGVDSYLDPETVVWLEMWGQLHGAGEAGSEWGFVPGEAAGFCLLASKEAAERYHLPLRGEVVAVATMEEKNRIKTEAICVGEGLTDAMRQVLGSCIYAGMKIDHTICDMNGEPYRADEFGYAMTRLNEHFVTPSDFLTPADCWGDIGAASGPLFVVLAAESWGRGYAKGPYQLIWTSSEGGERSAAILRSVPEYTGKR
jgi:3-oxoacyl-[acyl-carrier-protein] synthase-1